MKNNLLSGKRTQLIYLMVASAFLLFSMLGSREIWTQESRWADIVTGMFFRHDFFHPYLNDVDYYDKPLLSYWFIAAFSFVAGHVSTWTLRLPSALAGMLAVWSIYRLGTFIKNKELGLLSGWMLLTSYFFIFWSRTSSADMLNMAGTLLAVMWYAEKKDTPSLFNYSVFFFILAVTSLCKGLIGAIIPLLVIFPHLLMEGEWRKYLNVRIFLAMIPAGLFYLLPFLLSAQSGDSQNGLYLVYRENILRYFQPFDHKGAIYTYFIFLPVYLLPWTIFFIPTLFSLKARWKSLSKNARWMSWSLLLLFLFFTFSGSRRSYYVLPMIPFAILMTADWMMSDLKDFKRWAKTLVTGSFISFLLFFALVQPLYYSQGGAQQFAKELKTQASQVKPWSEWQVVMLNSENKTRFYLQLSPNVKNYSLHKKDQPIQTVEALLEAWPILKTPDSRIIFISQKKYEPLLKTILPHYKMIKSSPNMAERIFKMKKTYSAVAFIPTDPT